MLVLSRKAEEKIIIGEDIVITVVRVAGGRVQLGVEAPYEMSIKRSELIQRAPCSAALTRSAVSRPWSSAGEAIAFNYQ
jgi:carbon storage regulator